ncbi:MAG TPA: pyridoxamine 5'-phosphate oxidase family protein [Gemmatimonadales bacterium]|nr:pyridoxamine 5'-phosphate oxidase family protein [Gemmatimonadales bacterium]
MTSRPTVTIRDLEPAECEALLARHRIGRIAFSFKDRVDIQPISYVFEGGWLSCRTEQGSKLETLRQSPWVAFQVDEVHGPYDWESVSVRGTVYLMAEGSADHAATVAAIQGVAPQAFTDADPTPYRDVVFRVYPREMTGRRASSSGGAAGSPTPRD